MLKRNRTLNSLLIYLFLLILLPKNCSVIFGVFPVRLLLTLFFLIVVFSERKAKKITFNKINIHIFVIFYFLFLLFTIPSIVKSYNVITSLYTFVKFFLAFVVFLVCIKLKFSSKEYRLLFRCLCLAFFLKAVGGILEYYFDPNLFTIGSSKYPGSLGRISSNFFNPIYFGIAINLVFAYFFYSFYEKKGKQKLGMGILLYMLYICLLFTFTRSSFLVFCGIACLLFFFYHKMFLEKWSLLLIGLCLISSFLLPGVRTFMLSSINDSVMLVTNTDLLGDFLPGGKDSDTSLEDPSLEHRKEFAILANRIARNHFTTGVGFGTYLDYLNTDEFATFYSDFTLPKTHPHSAFVLLFAETGFISLLFYLCFLGTCFVVLAKNIYDNYHYAEEKFAIAVISFSIFLGFVIVNCIAENAVYDTQIYPLFFILMGLSISFCFRKKKTKVLFISSTGGHLTEMLQLKRLFPKYDYYLVTEKTLSNLKLKENYPKKVSYVIYGTKDHVFTYIFKLFINCFKELFIYLKFRPNVIVTTGAHTAGPMCCIGKLFGSKIIFIETFANMTSKTITGSLVYYFADAFIVQWESMLKYYPKAIVTEGVF